MANNSLIAAFEERILKHLCSMRSDFLHPYIGVKLQAYQDSVAFIQKNMPDAIVCNNRKEVFNYAISKLTINGIIAEFGVKSGKTISELANKPAFKKKTIFGFDSFTGIPDDWTGTKTLKGQLSNLGKLPKTPKTVELIPGWFKDSLPDFLNQHSDNFAFIHIDCDLYQSTKDIFNALEKRVTSGTVIVFDEFFNYPNWQNHEYKAWLEFSKEHKLKFKYLCYAHTQVAILVL